MSGQQSSGTGAFARSVFWNWLGVGAAIVGAFVLSPYMIRTLGDEKYGLWALVFSLVEYFGVLDLGFRSATVKYCAHHRTLGETDKVNEVVNTSVLYFSLIGIVVVALTLSVLPFVDRMFVVSADYVRTFRVLVFLMGCNYAIAMVGNVFQAGLEGFGRFDITGRTTIITTAVRIAGTFGLLATGGRLLSLGAFVAAIQVCAHAINMAQFQRAFPEFRFSRRFMKKAVLRELARYGVHTMTATAATQLLLQTPPLLIGHFRSAAAVGYFNIPVRLMQATGIEITARVSMVTGSRAAQLCAKRDLEGIGRLGVYTNRYCLALFMPLAIFLTIYGRNFLSIWIGPSWAAAAAPLLAPFVIGTALGICAQYNTSAILYGLAEHRLFARGLLVEGIVSAAALVFVIPRFGIEGAAWTAAVLMILNRGLFAPWILCRAVGWGWCDYLWSILARPLATAAPVFGLAWIARHGVLPGRNWVELGGAGLLIAAVYGGAALFTCLGKQHRMLAWQALAHRISVRRKMGRR